MKPAKARARAKSEPVQDYIKRKKQGLQKAIAELGGGKRASCSSSGVTPEIAENRRIILERLQQTHDKEIELVQGQRNHNHDADYDEPVEQPQGKRQRICYNLGRQHVPSSEGTSNSSSSDSSHPNNNSSKGGEVGAEEEEESSRDNAANSSHRLANCKDSAALGAPDEDSSRKDDEASENSSRTSGNNATGPRRETEEKEVIALDSDIDSTIMDCSSDKEEERDEVVAEITSHVNSIRTGRLRVAIQGLRAKARSKMEESDTSSGYSNTKRRRLASTVAAVDFSELHVVALNGKTFEQGSCYFFTADHGVVSVGIISFKSPMDALAILVVPYEDTVLGMEHEGVDFETSFQPSPFVQVEGETYVLPLKEFGDKNEQIESMPDLIHAPQTPKRWTDFAYYYKNVPPTCGCNSDIGLVELFSGAGGMHLGFKRSGFRTIRAVESNAEAVQTLTANNAGVAVYPGSVQKFMNQLSSLDGVGHIHSSSPCTGFSGANINGGKNDKANNDLSLALVEAVRRRRPRTASFENVTGMWRRKHMPYLLQILVELMKMKYQVRLCTLRACNYGDAQIRPRLIILAADQQTQLPRTPKPTHGEGTSQPLPNAKDAVDSVLKCREPLPNSESRKTSLKPGNQKVTRLPVSGPAPAVLASRIPPFHHSEDRCISVREAACLQSFPLDYVFYGSLTEQYKQVGNAVPVQLATAIARSVQEVHGYPS